MKVTQGIHAFIWRRSDVNNCNTYLINGPKKILIDPGHVSLFDHVADDLARMGLRLEDLDLVVCTHAHPDHLEGVQLFKALGIPTALGFEEWEFAQQYLQQAAAAGFELEEFMPEIFLNQGDLNVGDLKFKVYHTPGHSPGSICIYWPQRKALFTGDLIFKDGLGRTDLPGGDGSQLKKSILGLKNLDLEWIFPGHGDIIEGADAVKQNFRHLEDYWFKFI